MVDGNIKFNVELIHKFKKNAIYLDFVKASIKVSTEFEVR